MERSQNIKSLERFAHNIGCANFKYNQGYQLFTSGISAEDSPLTMHDIASCCIFFCQEGRMIVVLNNIEYIMQQNTLLVYRPSDNMEIRSDSRCRFICAVYTSDYLSQQFHFQEDVYSCLARMGNGIYLTLDNPKAERLKVITNSISSIDQTETCSEWLDRSLSASMKSLMCMVMYWIETNSGTGKQCCNYTYNPRGNDIFYKFVNLVAKHFKTERKVEYYATQLCITPKYLSHVVKEKSGKTASKWISDAVTGEINYLLSNTALSIKEISNTMNFSNASFFCKYFKKRFGTSPRRYRS